MKQITKLYFLLFVLSSLQSLGQIKIISNGNVGIGQSNPSSKLEVQGSVRFGNKASKGLYWEQVLLDYENRWGAPTFYCSTDGNFSIGKSTQKLHTVWSYNFQAARYFVESDSSKMKNIKPLGTTLKQLKQIECKSYNVQTSTEQKIKETESIKTDYGFIAQDMVKIFPNLVKSPDSLSQYYSVDYFGMIPVLVEAIKEQQLMIDQLQKQIHLSNKADHKIETSDSGASSAANNKIGQLEQTSIGSTKDNVVIRFSLSETASQVFILICDLQGLQKQLIKIDDISMRSLTVKASDFAAGMYYYTLIADGKEIDTKKMILTE